MCNYYLFLFLHATLHFLSFVMLSRFQLSYFFFVVVGVGSNGKRPFTGSPPVVIVALEREREWMEGEQPESGAVAQVKVSAIDCKRKSLNKANKSRYRTKQRKRFI